MVTIEETKTLEENPLTSVKGNLALDSDSIEQVMMNDGFLIAVHHSLNTMVNTKKSVMTTVTPLLIPTVLVVTNAFHLTNVFLFSRFHVTTNSEVPTLL